MVYLLAWFNEVGEREHLAFFVVAMSLGTLTLFELAIMRAVTPQQAGWLIRWAHVPTATAVLSIVAFLHFYFGSRRLWLGYAACALRLVALALNFSFEPNLNYASITHLQGITIFGEAASVPVGTPNPWMALGWLSSLALLLFALDATYSGWRRGTAIDRRRAMVIGGSLVIWVAVAAGYSALVTTGVVRFVFLFGVPSTLVMAAMAFELGADTVRTLQVTARLKQSEADLRRSEQRMQQAAEGAQLGIWEWDMQRDEIWATDQTRALFGVGPHTPLTLERFVLTLHPNDQGSVRQAASRLREHGGTFEQSYRVSLADGQARWLLTRGHTEADALGRPLLLRGVSVDITDRKVAEFEAEQQRNELTHLSRVTTLSELSGSLTHELSQPLTAILSNAQAALRFLAKPDPDIDEVREILRDIASDDQRAGEVIRGLHLMLKRGELRQESIDANELVRDVLKLVRGDILGAGVTLTVALAPALPLLARRPRAAAAGAAQSDRQRLRGHARGGTAPAPPACVDAAGRRTRRAGRRGRPRHRHPGAGSRARVRTVLHHQVARPGPRPVGVPAHHHRTRRSALGRPQPERRRGVLPDAARPTHRRARERRRMSSASIVGAADLPWDAQRPAPPR